MPPNECAGLSSLLTVEEDLPTHHERVGTPEQPIAATQKTGQLNFTEDPVSCRRPRRMDFPWRRQSLKMYPEVDRTVRVI